MEAKNIPLEEVWLLCLAEFFFWNFFLGLIGFVLGFIDFFFDHFFLIKNLTVIFSKRRQSDCEMAVFEGENIF